MEFDYYGYMHGKQRNIEKDPRRYMTLSEVFEKIQDKEIFHVIVQGETLNLKLLNGYEILVIKNNKTYYLTELYTLMAISKMKFFK